MDTLEIDYYTFIDYEYDIHNSCEDNACDHICRCSKITNFRIKNIDVSGIAKSIYFQYFDNSKESNRDIKLNILLYNIGFDMNLYIIDRIIRHHKIYDVNSWVVDIISGYYGEEISNIKFNNIRTLSKTIKKALSINEINKSVEYLLHLEYGYVLPELKCATYSIINVYHKDIKLYNDYHIKKVESENIVFYDDKNYSGIRGILLETKNGYRLIDGYHRLKASKSENSKFLVAKTI